MKPTLLRLSTLILSFTVGIGISLFFTNHTSDEATIPPVGDSFSPSCLSPDGLIGKGGNVIISVPTDDEFYIGKQKVELSQIPGRLMKLLGNQFYCDRVVFIKGAPQVRFQTLDLIVRQVRDVNVNRIEFVLDKKKRALK